MILTVGYLLLVSAVGWLAYTFAGYPVLLRFLATRKPSLVFDDPEKWPRLTITLPVYNEEVRIRAKLDELAALDYPKNRYRVLVISDASTDRTDEIVRAFPADNMKLIRLEQRGGKTAAENHARSFLWGDVVVNTDASVRVPPDSLKALIRPFRDPTVGVTTSRNVNVGRDVETVTLGEAWYTSGDMWMRSYESRLVSVVGASGALYASRKDLHEVIAPAALSRDFLAPLIAWEHGYRSVLVEEAVCLVPRTSSIRAEYRRKVRTMTRGIETLFYKKHLLNPFKHGLFAWVLFSHKLARWLMPVAVLLSVVGLGLIGVEEPLARLAVAIVVLGLVVSGLAWRWPEQKPMPVWLSAWVFLVSVVFAGLLAWFRAFQGDLNPTWEPTRRAYTSDNTPLPAERSDR